MSKLAVAFVAILAINVSFQSPTLKDIDKSTIAEVVQEVLDIYQKVLDVVNGEIAKFEGDQENIEQKLIDFAVEVGQKINGLIVEEINNLKDGATPDGLAVLNCIIAQEDNTNSAISSVFTEIGKCAAQEVAPVLKEVKAIASQLTDLKGDLQGDVDSLASCSDSDLICLLSFASQLSETVSKIPDAFTADIKEIQDLIEFIKGDVASCNQQVISDIQSEAQKIYNAGVECIKNSL